MSCCLEKAQLVAGFFGHQCWTPERGPHQVNAYVFEVFVDIAEHADFAFDLFDDLWASRTGRGGQRHVEVDDFAVFENVNAVNQAQIDNVKPDFGVDDILQCGANHFFCKHNTLRVSKPCVSYHRRSLQPNAAIVRQTIVANGTDTSATTDAVYNNPFNYTNPDFGFKAGSVAATGASFSDSKLSDAFFTQTTYKGAFGNNNKWADCWANFDPAAEDYNAGPYVQNAAVAAFNTSENNLVVTFTNGSIGKQMRFEWDFGVTSSTADTSTQQNPTFTYATKGDYLVTLKVISPCGDSTIAKTVNVIGNVGVNEVENVNNVTLYPNPTSNITNVSFDLTENTNVAIDLYDMSGRLVKAIPTQYLISGNNSITIETSEVNAGVYFANITTDKFSKTYRLVIIK